MSFISEKEHSEGLTFDDVFPLSAYSEVPARDIDLLRFFSRNIQVNTPVEPAAVTESKSDMVGDKGAFFNGSEELLCETNIYNERKHKAYRGMGSFEALLQVSKDRYLQDTENDINKPVPEGIAARVPHKGNLSDLICRLTVELRAGIGYCGSENITEPMNARFTRNNNAEVKVCHPNDVAITREASDYSR